MTCRINLVQSTIFTEKEPIHSDRVRMLIFEEGGEDKIKLNVLHNYQCKHINNRFKSINQFLEDYSTYAKGEIAKIINLKRSTYIFE